MPLYHEAAGRFAVTVHHSPAAKRDPVREYRQPCSFVQLAVVVAGYDAEQFDALVRQSFDDLGKRPRRTAILAQIAGNQQPANTRLRELPQPEDDLPNVESWDGLTDSPTDLVVAEMQVGDHRRRRGQMHGGTLRRQEPVVVHDHESIPPRPPFPASGWEQASRRFFVRNLPTNSTYIRKGRNPRPAVYSAVPSSEIAVRLTLRTLLAYLDDTLPPPQLSQISQQINESEVAQELMQRIQAVLQDRRLTTPSLAGPGAKLDPNTVADYLDNTLTGDQLADVEQFLLDSDLYLAEAAACHQILTLFLGQPINVPTLARKRMYGVGKQGAVGATASTAKDKTRPISAEMDDGEEGEEEYGELDKRRLGALVAVVGLAVLICLAVWQLWPHGIAKPTDMFAANTNTTGPEDKSPQPGTQPATQPATTPQPTLSNKVVAPTPPDKSTDKPPEKDPDKNTDKTTDKTTEKPPDKQPIDQQPKGGPSQERREGIGRQIIPTGTQPALLLALKPGANQWQKLTREAPVASTDTLMSLPGYRTDIQLESQVRLTLYGNLPEVYQNFTLQEFPALESRIVLHVPEREIDADLTLERGRIILASTKEKGDARVRVRMSPDEVWELTLPNKQTLVCIERTGAYMAGARFDKTGKGEGPMVFALMWGLKGQTGVKIRFREFALPEKSLFTWNSWQGAPKEGPQPAPALPRWFTETKPAATPYVKDTRIAVEELGTKLANKPVEVALAEARTEPRMANRIVALRCWAAIDGITNLMDALQDETDPLGREMAILSLRHWIGQQNEDAVILFKTLRTKMNYTEVDAEETLDLLFPVSQQAARSPETYEKLIGNLTHRRLPIRELSFWWLMVLAHDIGTKIKYEPAGDKDALARGQAEWKKRIPDGTVPPAPKAPTKG